MKVAVPIQAWRDGCIAGPPAHLLSISKLRNHRMQLHTYTPDDLAYSAEIRSNGNERHARLQIYARAHRELHCAVEPF